MGLMVKVFEVINSDGECMPPFTFLRNEPKHFKTSASSEHLLMFQVAVSEKSQINWQLKDGRRCPTTRQNVCSNFRG